MTHSTLGTGTIKEQHGGHGYYAKVVVRAQTRTDEARTLECTLSPEARSSIAAWPHAVRFGAAYSWERAKVEPSLRHRSLVVEVQEIASHDFDTTLSILAAATAMAVADALELEIEGLGVSGEARSVAFPR